MLDLDINLCAPAIIYLIFSITQILIDLFKGLYNTASIKVLVMIMITFLLNILCSRGLSIVSWIIVFIPFILMTAIVSIVLYVFGLNAATGTIHSAANTSVDASGNILVYDPNYDAVTHPFYYSWPNVVVQNPQANVNTSTNMTTNMRTNTKTNTSTSTSTSYNNKPTPIPPSYSSSPAYQSD
jgi:glucan phosphoethanolaminetransferase (alkaline phosphatase superfamily)